MGYRYGSHTVFKFSRLRCINSSYVACAATQIVFYVSTNILNSLVLAECRTEELLPPYSFNSNAA